MSNKTNRKNRTDLTVNWPSSNEYFTVKDLFQLNPQFIKITLRVRLRKAIEEQRTVAVIGTMMGSKGRPSLVYAMTPVSQELVESARQNKQMSIVGENELVKVLEITPTADPVNVEDVQVVGEPVSVE